MALATRHQERVVLVMTEKEAEALLAVTNRLSPVITQVLTGVNKALTEQGVENGRYSVCMHNPSDGKDYLATDAAAVPVPSSHVLYLKHNK